MTTKVVRFLILASACVGAEYLLFCDDPLLLMYISGCQIYTTSNSKTFTFGKVKNPFPVNNGFVLRQPRDLKEDKTHAYIYGA